MELLRIIPTFKKPVSDSVSGSLISSEIVEVESGSRQCVLNMVHDLPLNRLSVTAHVALHQLPHLLLALSCSLAKLRPEQLLIFRFILQIKLRTSSSILAQGPILSQFGIRCGLHISVKVVMCCYGF